MILNALFVSAKLELSWDIYELSSFWLELITVVYSKKGQRQL